jgi:hypothetical protein
MANAIATKNFTLIPPSPDRTVEPFNLETPQSDTVILTVYCNLKKDPQRQTHVDGNSYEYISPWYRTMKEKDLHGIIFCDNVSDDFITKYQTPKIRFLKIKMGRYSINDERYFIYYNFLTQSQPKLKYKYVLMTDVSDVEINRNPFELIQSDPDKIYVGMNFHGDKGIDASTRSPAWYDRRKWKIDPFNKKLQEAKYDKQHPEGGFKRDEHYQIWSAGLLGGDIQTMMHLLSEMCKLFDITDSHKNYNMLILNYILRRYFASNYNPTTACTDHIVSGRPFNSRFKRFEKYGVSDAFLIHK